MCYYHFWCHGHQCAGISLNIITPLNLLRQSKIGQLDLHLTRILFDVDEEVLELDVPMDNIPLVTVMNRPNHLGKEPADKLLLQSIVIFVDDVP